VSGSAVQPPAGAGAQGMEGAPAAVSAADAMAVTLGEGAGRFWLRAGAATLVLATLLLSGLYLAAERENQLAVAGALAKRRVTALADQLDESLRAAELVIDQRDTRLRYGSEADHADGLRWHLDRAAWLAALPLPFSLHRVDAAGLAQPLSGVGEPRPAGVVLPTTPMAPGDVPGTWHVGLPLSLPGGAVLPLVQRPRSAEAGTVGLAMHLDLDTLRLRLAQSLEGAQGGAALFRIESDARVSLLARSPDSPPHVGQPQRTALSEAVARAPSGQFATHAALDGVHRQVAYQRVDGANGALVLACALDTEALLARWHAQLPWVMGLALLLCSAIGFGARRLDRALGALQCERAALARSEAQFRALADNLPDVVARFAPDGRYLYANAAIEGATGLRPGQVLGHTSAELGMPAESVAIWSNTLAQAFATGQAQRHDFSFPGPDGPRQWEALVVLEPAQPGAGPSALVISRDITERHQAATAMAERSRQLREAQRIGQMGDWTHDLQSGSMVWSDQVYRLYEQEPGGFLPTFARVAEFTLPEDRLLLHAAMSEALSTLRPASVTHRVALPSGRIRHLQVEGEARLDASGQPSQVVGTVRDVTAQHEAEQAFRALAADLERRVQVRTAQLAQSEARYRRIFETVPVAIAEEDWSGVQQILRGLRAQGVTDLRAQVAAQPGLLRQCMRAVVMTRANPRTRALQARYPEPRNASGLQGVEVYYPSAALEPLFLDELLVLWDSRGQFSAQRHVRDREGRLLQLMLSATLPALDDADGQVLVCLVDVTDLEQARAELDRHVARLRQVNQELETFTYSVSHDLKAPLRGIDGYSRLLMSDHAERLDEEGQAFLAHIRRATQHMGVLIDDLLAYSRLERRELTLGSLHLAGLVQTVLAEFQPELAQRQVQLQVQVPDGLRVRADAQGLAMALRNLVDNALKFSRDHPTPALVVQAARVGDAVRLTVQDNGVGFDMKYHDRIFSIFQRLHRAEDYPGTGIGLAIVRKAVDRMGGRVWAEGRPGQGADFHLELPGA